MTFNQLRVSREQMEDMVEFIERNQQMLLLNFTVNFTARDRNALWQREELSEILNSSGGASKKVEKWKRCWSDLKTNVKDRARRVKNHGLGTGGGPSMCPLNNLELRVAALVGRTMIEVIPGSCQRTHQSMTSRCCIPSGSRIWVVFFECNIITSQIPLERALGYST